MLADQPMAWAEHPARGGGGQAGGLTRLWGALRATFLFAVWCTHTAADDEGPKGSVGVVQRAVDELQRVMWAQFRVAALQDDTLNALPTHLLSADLKPPGLSDFTSVWAHNDVLCSVEQRPNGGGYQLRMRLSAQHPVVAPGVEQADGVGGGAGVSGAATG